MIGDSPSLDSQTAGTTGVSHRVQSLDVIFKHTVTLLSTIVTMLCYQIGGLIPSIFVCAPFVKLQLSF